MQKISVGSYGRDPARTDATDATDARIEREKIQSCRKTSSVSTVEGPLYRPYRP
jgi:hypothetical protein